MDYEGEWGEGALDTPGPLNGKSEASAIWAQEVHNVALCYIKYSTYCSSKYGED